MKRVECLKLGLHRQKIVADIISSIHKNNPEINVYTIYNKYSLLDPKRGGGAHGDRFYIPREGYAIVVRPQRKAPDILVYKDAVLKSAWEITNYSKDSYMMYHKLYRYIESLKQFDCPRILVVSYPENFRKIRPDKTPEYNIEWVEKELAKNHIFLIYMESQDLLPEIPIIGWKE